MPRTTTTWLRALPLFEGLSERQLRMIAAQGQELEFGPEATIVAEGTKAIDFYVLLQGAARVTVGGRTRRRLASGDYFGEVSVLDGGPRTATVTAEEPVVVFRLERKAFVSVLRRNPEIAIKILAVVARRLREVEKLVGS
jgi:CRP-like cAMP-binding protein